MKGKKIIFLVLIIALLTIFLTGCVPGDGSYDSEKPAGFFSGLWHGIIAWFTFFMGLFTKGKYTIYESVNTGWAYNLGFLLGIGSSVGGITAGGVRKGCKKE